MSCGLLCCPLMCPFSFFLSFSLSSLGLPWWLLFASYLNDSSAGQALTTQQARGTEPRYADKRDEGESLGSEMRMELADRSLAAAP